METPQELSFMSDPKYVELLEIAQMLEVSIMHEIEKDGSGTKTTVFYQHADSVEVLAVVTGADPLENLLDAMGTVIENMPDDDEGSEVSSTGTEAHAYKDDEGPLTDEQLAAIRAASPATDAPIENFTESLFDPKC